MPSYSITFSDRETIVDDMQAMADEHDITVEQLIKRFICDGMRHRHGDALSIPSDSLDDFLVKNGVLKPLEVNTKD
ncbi:MAG TPA: hypothetical protein PK002_00800 [Cellvibrio sp.]|jgi:hypothetical protein|nr:hypothetical protein [Cellvibrio sp.]